MGDFRGFEIQPFGDFVQLGSQRVSNACKSSKIIARKDDGERVGLKKERVRREKMSEMFSELQALLPSLDRINKRPRERTVVDAIEYIKLLEEEKKSLEDLKKVKEMGANSKPILSECSRRSAFSSVNVSVANGVAFFGIELPSKRGLVTDIFSVFERYQAEVLAANIGTNDQHILSLSVTVLLEHIGGDSIEKIKREMLSL